MTYQSFSDLAAADGQIYLLFVPGSVNFPLDGVRYLEHEQRYTIPLPAGRVRDMFTTVQFVYRMQMFFFFFIGT